MKTASIALTALSLLALSAAGHSQQPNLSPVPEYVLDYIFFGDGVDNDATRTATEGTMEFMRTLLKNGCEYEARGTGGCNWSGMTCRFLMNRQNSGSATNGNAQIKRRTRDRCKLRAQGHSGQPMKVYFLVLVEGTMSAMAGANCNANAYYSCGISGENGASGGGQVSGGIYASNGGGSFFGTLPNATFTVGPINCTENTPFDLVQDNYLYTDSGSPSVVGYIGTGSCMFGNTFRTMGMIVKDAGDNVVSNFTLTSQLGVDWTKASNPAKLKSLTTNVTEAVGGTTVTGTVTLNHRAEQLGQTAFLKSKDTALATVPASFIIPYKATSGNFSIQTSPVGTPKTVDITVHMGAVTRTKTLTLTPAAPLAL